MTLPHLIDSIGILIQDGQYDEACKRAEECAEMAKLMNESMEELQNKISKINEEIAFLKYERDQTVLERPTILGEIELKEENYELRKALKELKGLLQTTNPCANCTEDKCLDEGACLGSQTTKKIVLCDLDGTLADCQHRVPLIIEKPKRWTEFFAACMGDKPIWHTIELINVLKDKYEIWIVSGRSDECRFDTEKWLSISGVNYDRLIMRRAGDFTDDGILKPSWIKDGTIPKDRVAFALDDRNRVVEAWRSIGVPCFQVAQGDF